MTKFEDDVILLDRMQGGAIASVIDKGKRSRISNNAMPLHFILLAALPLLLVAFLCCWLLVFVVNFGYDHK